MACQFNSGFLSLILSTQLLLQRTARVYWKWHKITCDSKIWAPHNWLELIGSAGGPNNSHTYPITAPNQPLNDILRHDITWTLWFYKDSPRCCYHPYLIHSSPTINIDVYNNVRIKTSAGARACVNSVCMKGKLADSHIVLSNTKITNLCLNRNKYKNIHTFK